MEDTQALLVRAGAGDRASLDALLARHQMRLLAYVRVVMDPALRRVAPPEDVLQEALLEAARKIDGFEYRGPSSFYRWLVAIARFKVSEAGRAGRARKRAALEPLEEEPKADGTSPSGRYERRERAARIREALEEIAPDQAEAVRMRYLEGWNGEETAARMGRTVPAVKSLLARGLDALALRLGPAAGDGPHPPEARTSSSS